MELGFGYCRLAGLLFVAAVVLSACGGDSGGGSTTPPVDYSGYQATTAQLMTTWGGIAATDPATLPLSGTASYQGVMQMDVQTASGIVGMSGALALSSNFLNSTITGSVQGVVDENNLYYTGSLAITGGVIDRAAVPAGYTYTANMDGTLTGAGEVFGISADLSGDFLGASYAGSSGIVAGTATSSIGSGTLFGTFTVEN